MNQKIRIVLEPNFKKSLFTVLLQNYSRDKLSNVLRISPGMLYHYKNNRVDNISIEMSDKICELLNLSKEDIKSHIIKTYSLEEEKIKVFQKGRTIREKQLKNFKDNLPLLKDFIANNEIDIEKWFFSYLNLINFGCREFKSIKKYKNKLELKYTNFSKGKKKLFITYLPRKIKLDRDFQYFFGLWVGDKVGGGRLGIMNKQKEINLFTIGFLKNLYQKPISVLHIHNSKIPLLDIRIDKIVKINSQRNGYAIAVYVVNGILKSFFDYIEKNLHESLTIIDKNIFFAGLFDAEGNIFLEDACFRWSCKNKKQVEIYKKHLTEMGLFKRYDGSNLVGYDLKNFANKIYPYLNHPKKINDFNLIYNHEGKLGKRFIDILKIIEDNPGKTIRELAKDLKRVKVYSQLNFLGKLGLIKKVGYPKRIYITDKVVASRLATGART